MTIRQLTADDAEAAALLSTELGYPAAPSEMANRIADRASTADLAAFAACLNEVVVGWLDMSIIRHLDGEPYAEICGLVVSAEHRSAGVGRQLVAHAEQWAIERGVTKMVIRSNVKREDAHRFYLREGYAEWKRQAVFTKTLGTAQTPTAPVVQTSPSPEVEPHEP